MKLRIVFTTYCFVFLEVLTSYVTSFYKWVVEAAVRSTDLDDKRKMQMIGMSSLTVLQVPPSRFPTLYSKIHTKTRHEWAKK